MHDEGGFGYEGGLYKYGVESDRQSGVKRMYCIQDRKKVKNRRRLKQLLRKEA